MQFHLLHVDLFHRKLPEIRFVFFPFCNTRYTVGPLPFFIVFIHNTN